MTSILGFFLPRRKRLRRGSRNKRLAPAKKGETSPEVGLFWGLAPEKR
ncbi:hypothetical protein [Vibrio nigripulchritudo]|nr:hypothetical protein [Vibrio nigripulchritudo]